MPSQYAEPAPKPVGNRSRRNKNWSREVENRVAKVQTDAGMPATRVPLSGALKGVGLDGDVIAAKYLAEVKGRTPDHSPSGSKKVTLNVDWIDKVHKEGAIHGLPGVVVLHLKGQTDDLVVMRNSVFAGLMGWAYSTLKEQKEK